MLLALCTLAGANLAAGARTLQHRLPAFGYPITPVHAFLRQPAHAGRVAGGMTALLPDTPSVYGIHSLEQVAPFHVARYHAFMVALRGPGARPIFTYAHATPGFVAPLLDLAAVRWLVSNRSEDAWHHRLAAEPGRFAPTLVRPRAIVYENRGALPRARVVYQAMAVAPDMVAAARTLAESPDGWRDRVLLETTQPVSSGSGPSTPATILLERDTEVQLAVEARAAGWLVLADTHYPGWVAEVDGRPTPILPAYVAFRAVAVPAGTHRVTFRYEPTTVRLGGLLSLLGLALVTLGLGWPRRWRRRSQG